MKKAQINRIVAFALGAIVLVAVVVLILRFLPFGKLLSLFGLNVVQEQEERAKADSTFRSFENSFEQCSAIEGDNCVCDRGVDIRLEEGMTLEVVPFQNTTNLNMAGYSTTLNTMYCAFGAAPIDVANWNYFKPAEKWVTESTGISELIRFRPGQNKSQVEIEQAGRFTLPYRLVKSHGRICFPIYELSQDARKCSELKQCQGTICNESQYCKGEQDPYYTGKGKCCSIGCSNTSVAATADDTYILAQGLEKTGRTDDAIETYKRFFYNYRTDNRSPDVLIKIGDLFMAKQDYSDAQFWYSRVIVFYPERYAKIFEADNKSEAAFKGMKMDCDSWSKPVHVLNKDKDLCIGKRQSLLNGCYYDAAKKDCVPCTGVRSINDPYSCQQNACANAGRPELKWRMFGAECYQGTREIQCSDITNPAKCAFDPCIKGEGNCCALNPLTDKCELAKSSVQ